jgi:PIN domain nuclease of toxin-antitoxin system
LVRRKKLRLELPVRAWAEELLRIPRVRALPLTWDIAVLADSLALHPDPADRFILATALRHDAPLLTKDALLHATRLVRTVW